MIAGGILKALIEVMTSPVGWTLAGLGFLTAVGLVLGYRRRSGLDASRYVAIFFWPLAISLGPAMLVGFGWAEAWAIVYIVLTAMTMFGIFVVSPFSAGWLLGGVIAWPIRLARAS